MYCSHLRWKVSSDTLHKDIIWGHLKLSVTNNLHIANANIAVGIGCSEKMNKRMLDYQHAFNLTDIPKFWGFLLSCVASLETPIPVEIISLPVIKVWKPDQLNYAEILATLIAHSMIDRSGLNTKGPGDKKDLDPSVTFEEEKQQVFVRREWAMNNLESSFEHTKQRIDALDCAKHFMDTGATQAIKDSECLEKTIDSVSTFLEELPEMKEKRVAALKLATKKICEENAQLDMVENTLNMYEEFSQGLDEWLAGNKVEDEESHDDLYGAN